MRIVVISDTHALHFGVEKLPEGDVLVHAGDFMNSAYDPQDFRPFNRSFGEHVDYTGTKQNSHQCCEFCRGDVPKNFSQEARSVLTNATYLENTGVTINNITFWGSPYTPEFLNWAFMYSRGSGAKHWEQVPLGLEVLINHGPPFGILDQVAPGEVHLGCAELLDAVEQKKPRVHLFGHIHGGAGTFDRGATRFVNAAYLNEQYKRLKPAGKIRIIDV